MLGHSIVSQHFMEPEGSILNYMVYYILYYKLLDTEPLISSLTKFHIHGLASLTNSPALTTLETS
jgi:hypothetical protein